VNANSEEDSSPIPPTVQIRSHSTPVYNHDAN
jgi:hypothetical protein